MERSPSLNGVVLFPFLLLSISLLLLLLLMEGKHLVHVVSYAMM